MRRSNRDCKAFAKRFNYEERRGVGDNSVGRDEGKKKATDKES